MSIEEERIDDDDDLTLAAASSPDPHDTPDDERVGEVVEDAVDDSSMDTMNPSTLIETFHCSVHVLDATGEAFDGSAIAHSPSVRPHLTVLKSLQLFRSRRLAQ